MNELKESMSKNKGNAGVAQSVEQMTCKQMVEGSIPSVSSMLTNTTSYIDWGECNTYPNVGG